MKKGEKVRERERVCVCVKRKRSDKNVGGTKVEKEQKWKKRETGNSFFTKFKQFELFLLSTLG